MAGQIENIRKHRNNLSFERNQRGHIIVTVTGLDLTGAEEIARLETAGYCLNNWAKSCLLSTNSDSYDANHRLVAGQSYKIALMSGIEIIRDSDRTTENLRKRGMEHYGYGKPLAGIVPRILEAVSNKQMEDMVIRSIHSLHDPIKDSDGELDVLGAYRYVDGRRDLGAGWGEPSCRWDNHGVFTFPVPQV